MSLTEKVKNLPISPGVYLMKDALGHIIYVGKAKYLKKRVQSYFQNSKAHPPKVKILVRNIRDLDYILTDTEFEAFMLECKLIKQLKPMYNKKMKNPLVYNYIVLRAGEEFRYIETTYLPIENDNNLYFGPYTSRSTVERALQGIKEYFKILCSSTSTKNTPCLNHSLGLCIGICLGGEAIQKYNDILDRVIALLNGSDMSILDDMEQRMVEASERYDFEAAAKYRDYIGAVNFLLQKEKVIGFAEENKNIAIVEAINDQALKLILLKGNTILIDKKVAIESSDTEPLHATIRSTILNSFKPQVNHSSIEVSRYDIDEAQIIYSYLKGSSCSYIIVPEEWLNSKNHKDIDKEIDSAIDQLLQMSTHPIIEDLSL